MPDNEIASTCGLTVSYHIFSGVGDEGIPSLLVLSTSLEST